MSVRNSPLGHGKHLCQERFTAFQKCTLSRIFFSCREDKKIVFIGQNTNGIFYSSSRGHFMHTRGRPGTVADASRSGSEHKDFSSWPKVATKNEGARNERTVPTLTNTG